MGLRWIKPALNSCGSGVAGIFTPTQSARQKMDSQTLRRTPTETEGPNSLGMVSAVKGETKEKLKIFGIGRFIFFRWLKGLGLGTKRKVSKITD